jgi:hypothetical protein
MRKIYRSTIELPLFLPVAFLLIVAEIFLLANQFWLFAFLALVLLAFLVHLYMNTSYELTKDKKLRVKSSFFFEREIHVNSIHKIRPTRNHSASPALSNDRIEIFYNRYGSMLISPEHRTEFIEELKRINPKIAVDQLPAPSRQSQITQRER